MKEKRLDGYKSEKKITFVDKKRATVGNVFLLIFILLVGIIVGIILCCKWKHFHLSEMENKKESSMQTVVYGRKVWLIKNFLTYEVQDFIDELDYLGTISMNFPKSVPEGAGKLYENEYIDAVVKLFHSLLFDYKEYGNYLIYIGDYGYSELAYEKEKYDYNIIITVAIVGEETGYWWEFHAKEDLGENGEVILESNGGDSYSSPGDYNQQNGVYAPDIDSIIHANRLVIPLLVTENDKVEKIEIRRDERDINLIHYYLK